jgi:Ca-activated chloride channel family protein
MDSWIFASDNSQYAASGAANRHGSCAFDLAFVVLPEKVRPRRVFMPEHVALKHTKSASVRGYLALLLFTVITNLIGVGQTEIPRFTASTELVQVSVIALDQEGRIATGLTRQDFEVFEDGVKQDIIECMSDAGPVSIAFVLDKSRSMRTNLPLVIKGAFNLLDTHFNADDEFLLVAFDSRPQLILPQFTGDTETLKQLISNHIVEAKGLTSLYDAIYLAVGNVKQKAKNVHRGVIVITDGGDTNSIYSKRETLEYLEEAEVPVFAVNANEPNIFQTFVIGKSGKPEFLTEEIIGPAERDGPKVLKELTGATGGAVFTAHQPEDIPRIMAVAYDLISHQYTISYKPRVIDPKVSGRHKIHVNLTARDNKFAGYYLRYKQQYTRPNDHGGEKTNLDASARGNSH